MEKIRITIDTNRINVRNQIFAMNTLENMQERGIIEIVKTDAMDTEMLDGKKNPYHSGLRKSQKYQEIQGYGFFGHSRFEHNVFGNMEDGGLNQSIVMALFPGKSYSELSINDCRDVMHIQAHIVDKAAYFVTNDGPILRAAENLTRLGVQIRTPEVLLKELENRGQTPRGLSPLN